MITAVNKISKYNTFGSILTLDRVGMLLNRLGNPEKKLKFVHIAGTNGKGSVSKYIYEIFKANGFCTGLFTSPYIEDFNERIELNGEYISDQDLEAYTAKVTAAAEEIIKECGVVPTQFDIITAIAFLYFADKRADYVILEVGLGGRSDSTNIISSSLVSIFTSISMDHMQVLGDTIEEIAFEKAGIIRKGCPVICGPNSPVVQSVLKKKCAEVNSIDQEELSGIYLSVDDTKVFDCTWDLGGQSFSTVVNRIEVVNKKAYDFTNMRISMLGNYQIDNAVTALTAIQLLADFHGMDFYQENIKKGLSNAKQKCRFEILNNYILDGAHNEDASNRLAQTVAKYFPGEKILMVVGIVKDKDATKMIKNFSSITKDFVVTGIDYNRQAPPEELANIIKKNNCGADVTVVHSPAKAVEVANKVAIEKGFDRVLVAGSLYLSGEVRKLVKNVIL